MKNKIKIWAPFLLVCLILIFLGYQDKWHTHLAGDIGNYYWPTGIFVFFHQNPTALKVSEILVYPPGANLVFAIVSLSQIFQRSLIVYEYFFVLLNLMLLGGIYWFFSRQKGITLTNLYIYLLFLIAAGPLILFRFDTVVIFLLILSIHFFNKSSFWLSGFMIGLAISVKVFPLFLVPYFCLLLYLKKGLRGLIFYSLSATTAIAVVVVCYVMISRQSLSTIETGIGYHFIKAVHVESIYGTILTLVALLKHPVPPPIEFTNGVFGLSWQYLLGHKRIFNYFGILGVSLTYGIILVKFLRQQANKISYSSAVLITIMVCIVATSQVISPQYLYWPFLLVPSLAANTLKDNFWKINLVLIFIIFLLTQIVYPLNYNMLVFAFYGARHDEWIFWVMTTRNLILLLLAIRLFYRFIILGKKEMVNTEGT